MSGNTMESAATASDTAETTTDIKQLLSDLHVKRETIDTEAQAIIGELTAPVVDPTDDSKTVAPMGFDTPLVDHDGYPRGDIDVYRARSLRQRLNELQTDRTYMTQQMEKYLQQLLLHESPQASEELEKEMEARKAVKPKPKFDKATGKWIVTTWDGTMAVGGDNVAARVGSAASDEAVAAANSMVTSSSTDETTTTPTIPSTTDATRSAVPVETSKLGLLAHASPFARIDSVANDSPAQKAGLQQGDLIVSFDGLTISDDLDWLFQQVAARVSHAAEHVEDLTVIVMRSETNGGDEANDDHAIFEELRLYPGAWAGRGFLGCHLVPIKK
ncbi:putative 26S proteasome regulatory subunit [Mayamaea pseudoterrestris]|nr:putative 26S proteasome regulatory subunit [Mayamaea pseudoterrestris]